MKKIKVMVIFGTRPEAIKMAPLIKVLKEKDEFECKVVVTSQHRQMLDQVLGTFRIIPDYDLNIMRKDQTLTEITIRVLGGLELIIKKESPDIVMVHGDTSTTFTASLAAFYQRIPVAHVEAGLRTWDKYSPFPEEINRQLTDVLAAIYLAPTKWAAENLLRENKPIDSIFITGNTVIDAFQTTIKKNFSHPILERIKNKKMILLTSHRRENLGKPMAQVFRAVRRIVDDHNQIEIVYPIHLNPQIQQLATELLNHHPRIHLIDPLDVIDFHNFESRAHLILTDSGGIQEEAPSFGVPVLVLRNTTERPEGVEVGTLRLVGTDEDCIYQATNELLIDSYAYEKMSKPVNPFGDGKASIRIAESILYYFGYQKERPMSFS